MTNTYDRRTQRLASKRRYEDAVALQDAGRWNGAIYLGGYAIECSLKALICYTEGKTVVTETKMFNDGVQGASLHDLVQLLACASTEVDLMIHTDKTRKFNEARKTVTGLWQMSELRYEAKVTHKNECERFMAAVELLYYSINKRLDKYDRV